MLHILQMVIHFQVWVSSITSLLSTEVKKCHVISIEISVFDRFFDQKKPNAESGILSGYFSQNIPSHDLGTGFKSN